MNSSTEKDKVFGDYAAFLHALLPQSQGFLFHDRHARLFWHDNAPDTSQLGEEFHSTLNRILRHGDLPGDAARIPLRDSVAYLIRLVSDKGKTLGVLTALVDRDVGTMPHQFCSNLLKPARRSMERELSLRVHLLDANRIISDHDSEHQLLKTIGEIARSNANCETALRDILQLTVQQLALDGAVVYSPVHDLRIAIGESPVESTEAELLYDSLVDLVDAADGDVSQAMQNRSEPDSRERARCWPILEDGKVLAGVMVLSRPANVAKLCSRSTSIAGFIASTIENLLERSFDAVTGLMTWPGFEQALMAARDRQQGDCTVLYLDMDQLHVLNDALGRDIGDRALRELGLILRGVLTGQPVTRVTSDSFAALLLDTSLCEAKQLGSEICQRLQALEFTAEGQSFRPSASIGVATLGCEGTAASSLLVPAQIACQAAKDRGRSRVETYEATDHSIIRRMDDLNQVGSIRSAIEGGRLVLFAQPIRYIAGERAVAYHELLVRMLNTAGEPVPPSEFMGAAERYQLMQELDRWVVNKAINTLAEELHDSMGRPIRFAINLSGQSLGSEKFLAYIKQELARTGLDPSRLCLEITETVAVSNLKKAQVFIRDLRELGCQFSLDDFGTGLSSFAYLKMFPIDKLKIDGSFVQDICENEVSRSMVSAIAEIARVMGIETVAEYVQSEDILMAVGEIGVDWAQGYHVGEPIRLRDLFENSTIVDKADLADVDPSLIEKLPA